MRGSERPRAPARPRAPRRRRPRRRRARPLARRGTPARIGVALRREPIVEDLDIDRGGAARRPRVERARSSSAAAPPIRPTACSVHGAPGGASALRPNSAHVCSHLLRNARVAARPGGAGACDIPSQLQLEVDGAARRQRQRRAQGQLVELLAQGQRELDERRRRERHRATHRVVGEPGVRLERDPSGRIDPVPSAISSAAPTNGCSIADRPSARASCRRAGASAQPAPVLERIRRQRRAPRITAAPGEHRREVHRHPARVRLPQRLHHPVQAPLVPPQRPHHRPRHTRRTQRVLERQRQHRVRADLHQLHLSRLREPRHHRRQLHRPRRLRYQYAPSSVAVSSAPLPASPLTVE